MNGSCMSCRFRRLYEDGTGDCCRFPPQHVQSTYLRRNEYNDYELVTEHASRFPAVLDGWWCGEYQPVPEEPK